MKFQVDFTYSLPWPNPGTLANLDGGNTCASNGQVFIGACNCVYHLDDLLLIELCNNYETYARPG